MFCPVCKSEFREGFTRCGSCEVDLVAELGPGRFEAAGREPAALGPLVDYCGFLSLDDARYARDRLRHERLHSEIVIRDRAAEELTAPVEEEYWIRVPATDFRATAAILGDDLNERARTESDETVACSECGKTVGPDELFCPHCGAKFD
jgi:hypothetical protein